MLWTLSGSSGGDLRECTGESPDRRESSVRLVGPVAVKAGQSVDVGARGLEPGWIDMEQESIDNPGQGTGCRRGQYKLR